MNEALPPPDADGLIWLPTCASTNDLALAQLDDPRVVAIGADHQAAGRGRRGRSWASPPGTGMYLTWIARPRFSPELGSALPLLAAVAVAEQCRALGVVPTLKWPNDLLLDARKLGGILCEARSIGDRWAVAVGIGLNLRTPPGGWPADVTATALDARIDDVPAPRLLAKGLLPRLATWLKRVTVEGLDPVLRTWTLYSPPWGTRLRQGAVEGRYAGLASDGALLLDTDDRGEVMVRTGEVELIHWGEGLSLDD